MFREQICNKIAQTDGVWQEILPNFHQKQNHPSDTVSSLRTFVLLVFGLGPRKVCDYKTPSVRPQSLANQELVTLVTI